METPQGKYFGWPGWIQRLDDVRSVMHNDYPIVVYFNESRPVGYQWELWKSWDPVVVREDDLFLGTYPSCELAMDSIEGWFVLLLSRRPESKKQPSKMMKLGAFVRKTIKQLRYY